MLNVLFYIVKLEYYICCQFDVSENSTSDWLQCHMKLM